MSVETIGTINIIVCPRGYNYVFQDVSQILEKRKKCRIMGVEFTSNIDAFHVGASQEYLVSVLEIHHLQIYMFEYQDSSAVRLSLLHAIPQLGPKSTSLHLQIESQVLVDFGCSLQIASGQTLALD
jgi:hypothetical protein